MNPANKKTAFFCSSTGWGGLEMNVLKLARLLMETGISIELICTSGTRLFEEAEKNKIPAVGIKRPKKHFDIKSALRLGKILKRKEINILFAFDNYDLSVCAWVKRLFPGRFKLIYQQHMQIGINKKDLVHTLRYSKIDIWISPLAYLAKEVIARTNFREDRIRIIPLGADVKRFTESNWTKTESRKYLGLKEEGTWLGIIGRLDPKKGQDFILDCFEDLSAEFPELQLLIVGQATVNDPACIAFEKTLHKKADKPGLRDKIVFLPYNNDILPVYKALDIFILPSSGETYGMVTIEAMLSGIPVIGTNTSGTPEILEYGACGGLFTTGNKTELIEACRKFFSGKDVLNSISIKAKQSAVARFSQDHECAEIAKLIRSF
jgi:D-inositol-3-phosphate glycosyltransferase